MSSNNPLEDIQGPLEIDSGASDSAYGDDNEDLSASITSSILAFREENGRRYHAFKDGAYIFPNDDTENDRLDLQHAVYLKSLDGKLFLAPIKEEELRNVLDIGTGTGIWAIDLADQYPEATVLGTDLSPIQPSWVPPNLSFLIDDCEDDWIFEQKFDLIHARMMCGSLKDWPRFMEQAYENLEPGGWLEFHDIDMPFHSDDGTLSEDTALWKWGAYMVESGVKAGRPLNAASQYKGWMEAAGFVDIHEVVQKWPQNPWAKEPKHKEIGLWTMQNLLQGLQGLSMRPFTAGLGWSVEAVEVFLADVRKDIVNRKIRTYWQMHYVYGRKPDTR